MKAILILYVLLLFGCKTNNQVYYGTTGSRYGISPFPSKDRWVEILRELNLDYDVKSSPTILWVVGSYSEGSIKLSYPGANKDKFKIEFSEIDLNEEYFAYFDKKKINVFLMIEAGDSNIAEVIREVSDRYSAHSSIKGFCIDLEWYRVDDQNPFGRTIDSNYIKSILFHIKNVNPKYKLILKHWNINNIEHYDDNDIIYLQSLEGVRSIKELKNRHQLWYKKFYPSNIGIEIGFSKDLEFWKTIPNSKTRVPKMLNSNLDIKSSVFWSETSLYK